MQVKVMITGLDDSFKVICHSDVTGTGHQQVARSGRDWPSITGAAGAAVVVEQPAGLSLSSSRFSNVASLFATISSDQLELWCLRRAGSGQPSRCCFAGASSRAN